MEVARNMYLPAPPADPERAAARRDLADSVRRLAEDLLFTDGATAELRQLAAEVEAVRSRLAGLPSYRDAERSEWPDEEEPLARRGPFSGVANAIAPPLHFVSLAPRVKAWAEYGPAYEGGPGDVHGGMLMGAFDDVMSCAQMTGTVIGRTGTLTVRFRSPPPLGRVIEFEAWVDRVERRKVFTLGTAHAGETLLAEAEAIFVAPKGWPGTDG